MSKVEMIFAGWKVLGNAKMNKPSNAANLLSRILLSIEYKEIAVAE